MSDLPDVTASRAILIGVHSYHSLNDIPAVKRNLAKLHEVFTDEAYWGLPEDHCVVLEQPANARLVLDQVLETARQATDALVLYYAGHGLPDLHTDELCFALPDSNPDIGHTALRYEEIRRILLGPDVPASRKVVILDCCYSGRALLGGMDAGNHVASQAITEGSYLLTASAETSKALSPPGEPYTAFTGELIDVLINGVPGGSPVLDMDLIYRRVHMALGAKGRPAPQQRNRNTGAQIALVRNSGNQSTDHVDSRSGPTWTVAEIPGSPLRDLHDELQLLHITAGRPDPHAIEAEIRARGESMSWTKVYELLTGRTPQPAWKTVKQVVIALGGDAPRFKVLWRATVPAPDPVPDQISEASKLFDLLDVDKDYKPKNTSEIFLGPRIYEDEFHQEFGHYFDKGFFDKIVTQRDATRPSVRRQLIHHAANQLKWSASDPYLIETPRARIVNGLLAYAEQQRRAQLTELARLAAQDCGASRLRLTKLASNDVEVQATILAALGSRDASAAGKLLMDHVNSHTEDSLGLIRSLVTKRALGARALLRAIAAHDHNDLGLIFILVESGQPEIRQTLVQLLE